MSNYTENRVALDDPNHTWSKILGFIPDGSSVLDIGCSSGNLGSFLMSKKNCLVDGVEPNYEDSKLALNNLHKVWNLNIEDAVKKISERYDVMIFADVLEHLIDPVDVLKSVRKLLKPKGRVVFSIPNMAHVSNRLALLEGEFDYTETGLLDKTHLHFYNRKNIVRIFEMSGMHVEKLDATQYKYTNDLIKERLEQAGFTAQEKGIKTLQSIDATAFQWNGFAKYGASKGNIKLPAPAIQKDVRLLVGQMDEARHQNSELQRQNAQLQRNITQLTSSFSWKVTKPLRLVSWLARKTKK